MAARSYTSGSPSGSTGASGRSERDRNDFADVVGADMVWLEMVALTAAAAAAAVEAMPVESTSFSVCMRVEKYGFGRDDDEEGFEEDGRTK